MRHTIDLLASEPGRQPTQSSRVVIVIGRSIDEQLIIFSKLFPTYTVASSLTAKMVNFDYETATATELMNEIIRITLTEYNALGEKIAQPCPEEEEQEMVDEMMEKYLDNERILDVYFEKLKELLRKSPPGRKELEMKEREIENLIKKNGLK